MRRRREDDSRRPKSFADLGRFGAILALVPNVGSWPFSEVRQGLLFSCLTRVQESAARGDHFSVAADETKSASSLLEGHQGGTDEIAKGLHRCKPLSWWRAREDLNPRSPGS